MSRREKGITLIALVITIIVLLILAGVSIAMLTGENGILNRAILAREEASHGEVREQVLLAIAEYELEKNTPEGNKAETIIDYLGQNGYLTEYDSENPKESYVIPKAKLGEATLGKGTSKETGDVYIIEKANLKAASITKLASTQEVSIKIAEASTDNNWVLRYYKTSENSEDILNFSLNTNESYEKKIKFFVNGEEYKCIEGSTFLDWFKTFPNIEDYDGHGPKEFIDYYNEKGDLSGIIYMWSFLADEETGVTGSGETSLRDNNDEYISINTKIEDMQEYYLSSNTWV